MANTFSVTSVLDHTTDAAYHAWVAEVISALVTSIGLTQTADTGQTTNGGTTRPGVNTAGGYIILRFNDTAQSTSPVFIKLEFGTGGTTTSPQMWITVGQGSNGSGTLTGTLIPRSQVGQGSPATSNVTSYVSRYVWNPTYGFLTMVFKTLGGGTSSVASAGFTLMRSTSNTGAVTTDAVALITNFSGSSSSACPMQIYSYLTAALVSLPSTQNWGFWPFSLTTTTVGGQIQLAPIYMAYPTLNFHTCIALGLVGETPVGNTTSLAMIGSTALTFLSVGSPYGGASTYGSNLSPVNVGVFILWQ